MYSFLLFLLLCLSDVSLIEGFGFSVELIHRDSPKSPFYLYNETHYERVAKAIHRSINRASNFNKHYFSTKNIESNVFPTLGEYLMSYSIGTPPVNILGILDTGSDIVWLQCQPCHPCYKQTTPIFDPSKSTTYKTLLCTSNTCETIWGGSNSEGNLSLDTLTLSSTNGSAISFPKTVIGCGNSNTTSFVGEGSGIIGLGNGPVSLITQLGSLIQGKFSYCLGPQFSGTSSPSKLNFGDDAVVSGDGSVSTPMYMDTIFYYLTLKSFSVGTKRVKFPRSSYNVNGHGNIIIDSGTTLTLLPKDVYSVLESLVADAVELERVDDPSNFLSLCYKYPLGEKLEVPTIIAHFTHANVHLNALNTFVKVSDDVICFAFRPIINSLAIFGNLAQQNFLVGYDLQKENSLLQAH
ncbi:hypothetical protein Lal_00033101 [Lupinus albus]|nr:hypothetical protein Lal_00033101 [Lupinus albus]